MRKLDFYFFLGSTYSYLSVVRAAGVAAANGVDLVWHPFSVRTLMREQNNVPFIGKPAKLRYMWRDIERRARRLGVPYVGIPPYPIDADESANRVATLAATEGWCEAFVRGAYKTWFLEGRDPGQADVLEHLLTSLDRDAERCIARASDQDVRDEYRRRTERARELGIFGSPTFVAGDEVFWGDDRLDDAIEWVNACSSVMQAEPPATP